jgi:isopentenyl-diphosphate Delta-isomerase
MTSVILVDEQDVQVGTMEKLEAHLKGMLHRAISVFIFNSSGQLLLQQRAKDKYHSPGLWTNTCCSHPAPGEYAKDAAERRLAEEMGIKCDLQHIFQFTYKAAFDNGLTENELDHIFIGFTDEMPEPDPEEAASWKYAAPSDILTEMEQHPEIYTVWFRLLAKEVFSHDEVISKTLDK